METKKALGRQGWWFAKVDGVAIPCAHKYWLKDTFYYDSFERHKGKGLEKKINEAVGEMIAQQQVVLTDDHVRRDAADKVIGFERKNYIAVFAIDDAKYDEDYGLSFRLTKRLCHLK